MRATTYYYNADGKLIKKHSGEPRNASVFERNSADAVRIKICYISYSGYCIKVFNKLNGRWLGDIYRCSNG